MEYDKIIQFTQQWVESFVVELNLCPFAKRELINNRVRFSVTEAITEEQLLETLQIELELLNNNTLIETTLLIHPRVLQDFYDYNQFLNFADSLLLEMELVGVYQIASFHPDYQFSDTNPEDVENYTNRSPFPMLHILREESLEKAIDNYPDVDQIPSRNIELINSLGADKLERIYKT
ncbi:MAG: DUF1415 domain-containing protein [Gammaproteobacteria bacterium]|nr:DUF1415 domain-containing protein [Gammaproteobacteria bacterium]